MEEIKIEEGKGVRSKVRAKDAAKAWSSEESREQQFTEVGENVALPLQAVGSEEEKPPDEYREVMTTEMRDELTEYMAEDQIDTVLNVDNIPTPRTLMKVDKSVSTNDTLEDLQRALAYEVMFSSLLEKKVLAIKRECEERKRAKRMKRKSIGRIFFSRKLFGGSRKSRGDSEPDVFMRGDLGAVLASPPATQRITKTAKKPTSSRDGRQLGDEIEIVSGSASNGSQRSQLKQATRAQKVTTRSSTATTAHGATAGSTADDSITSTLSNSSDKNAAGEAAAASGGGAQPVMRRSLLVRAQTHTPAEVMTSSSGSGDSRALTHRRSMSVTNGTPSGNGAMGGIPVSLLERTYDTASLASGYDNGTCARLHTSTMADDSLTSLRDSIESLSFASSRCAVSFGGAEIIPEETASLLYERARLAKRLRILEAKSISAQCSPILPRHLINAIAAPPEPVSALAKTAPTTASAMPAAATRHIITPTTAVPYSASSRTAIVTSSTVSDMPIVPVPTSNKVTQTKQHIFRHQVSYTDSSYGGAGDFGDASAYSRYISRQNTSEDSANLTVSTFLNQSDSLSLHAPIYSPTGSATGDSGGVGGIGAFMLGDRYKSKSTSLLVVSGHGRSRPPPPPQTQILRAPFVAPMHLTDGTTNTTSTTPCVSGTMPSNIRPNDQLVDSLNTNTFASSGIALPPDQSFNAQRQISSQSKFMNATATTTPAAIYAHYPSSSHAAAGTEISTAVIALNGTGFRNGHVNGAIVSGAALPGDTAKLNRMTSTSTGSSVAPTGCCTTTKSSSRDREKEKQRFIPSWPSGQSGSDDEYRKRKRKYKRHHRCSDPVLVYPTPSGLQHCILSMPTNEPVQLQYNDDFVYDMQIQMDSDKNDDLEEIVPSGHHRHRRHRHHRHKKRHRHKKPKILVQDLETRVVKVVDPDDLSQRARWTIIVTACLLLIMCLMLVGITLRMAPLIDDMVTADETTDISGIEQFSIGARYVQKGAAKDVIREDFLCFVPVEDVTGAGLANTLLTTLKELGIQIQYMKGQGYDGARAMSGEFKGCAAIVQNSGLDAPYLHCANHNLNLAICHACDIAPIRNCLGTVKKVVSFFRICNKAGIILKQHIVESKTGAKQTRLLKFCETRWIEHLASLNLFYDSIEFIASALEEMDELKVKSDSVQPNELLAAIQTPQFIISLTVLKPIFGLTKSLSLNLQKEDCDLSDCIEYANDVHDEIKDMRTKADETFREIFESATHIAQSIGTILTVPRRAGRQKNRDNYGGDAEEYYRRSIYIPFLDKYSEELESRFLKQRDLLSKIQNVIPAKCAQIDEAEIDRTIFAFKEVWPNEFTEITEEIKSDFKMWKRFCMKIPLSERPKTFLEALDVCDVQFYKQIYRLLQISATLPVQ